MIPGRILRGVTLALSLTLAALIPGPARAAAAQTGSVTVFAAASLKDALDQVARDWQKATGTRVTVSYAGSGQLAQQIIAGAPADLYLSANVGWMDAVAKAGLIVPGARKDLLGNSLVLVAHGKNAPPVTLDKTFDLKALLKGGKLAMALVSAVPAGIYGKAALESLGQWDKVAPQVAQADNVRAALALVSTDEAPYGIVYATDARIDPGVSVVATFPTSSHPPILYPAALLKGAATPEARAFYDALSAPEAARTFAAYGFRVLKR